MDEISVTAQVSCLRVSSHNAKTAVFLKSCLVHPVSTLLQLQLDINIVLLH